MINFDNTDQQNTVITCQTQPSQVFGKTNYGNRGINVVTQNVFTPFASLSSTNPSINVESTWLDVASYRFTNQTNVTVWLTGYLAPSVSSEYLFSLSTNAFAQLYLSNDSSSTNRVNNGYL